MACGGGESGGPGAGTPRAALLALPRTDTTPPPARTFAVRNHLLSTFQLRHSDSTGTLFAEFRFTPRSIVFANGVAVCDTCTVFVTITPLPGLYGFTIGPSSLVFSSVGSPVVTLSFGTYGNLGVHDSSARYPTPGAYAQALAIWYERNPDAWEPERNSAPVSGTSIASAVDAPVTHLLAAPR